MNKSSIFLFIIISVLVSFITTQAVLRQASVVRSVDSGSVYDHVISSGTLRCGYAIWEPLLIKDPNTGQLSGIFVDYMEALGKALNIKVVFAEEIGWGDLVTAVQNNRVDAICAGVWTTSARARGADFTRPIGYQVVNAYVRQGDARFDNKLDLVNAPDVTISTIDGEMSSIIAAADFSQAKTAALPQTGNAAQMLLNVADGKADITFTDTDTAENFMASNPNKLKELPGGKGLRAFATGIMIKKGEGALASTLNTATQEMIDDGVVGGILKKWRKYPGTIYDVMPAFNAQ